MLSRDPDVTLRRMFQIMTSTAPLEENHLTLYLSLQQILLALSNELLDDRNVSSSVDIINAMTRHVATRTHCLYTVHS